MLVSYPTPVLHQLRTRHISDQLASASTVAMKQAYAAKPLVNSGASLERYSDIAAKAEHRRSACAAFPRRSACAAFPPRDIEVVVESALSPVVVVSALWNWRFRCRVSATKIWRFPPLVFCFLRNLCADLSSALPARPRSVISTKPSATVSRIAAAIEWRWMP
jgi:hypothetical protein